MSVFAGGRAGGGALRSGGRETLAGRRMTFKERSPPLVPHHVGDRSAFAVPPSRHRDELHT